MKEKRIIYPLLFSMIFTLTACENLHSANTQGAGDGAQGSGTEESTALHTGAPDTAATLSTYVEKNHADCGTSFAETADGYYYYDGSTERICYYEKSGNRAVPLCSRADCSHSENGCNAYVAGMSGMTLTLIGEKLYYVAQAGGEAAIYCEAADGTGGVEKLVTICKLYGDAYGVTEGIFDRGYLYYVRNEIDAENDREYYNLYRIRVENGAEPELIYKESDEDCTYNIVGYLKSEGDGIFFSNMVLKGDGYYGQIQKYNVETKTVEAVFSYEDGNVYNGRYEVSGDTLYLVKTGGTVERYDMETRELSVFYEDETGAETNCEIEFDGTYFYLDNGVDGNINLDWSNRQINVRDVSGALAESIALPDHSGEIYCAFSGGIVYQEYGENGCAVFYADKGQIGTGTVEFLETSAD